MGHILIVTEKPTAAQKIAEALAEDKVKKIDSGGASYYNISRGGKKICIVPAVGHLFVLSEKGKGSRWTYPIFDVEWKPSFSDKDNIWSKKYYDNILKLSKDADEFVSACDFDIEGSTIAFNVLRFICKTEKGKRMRFSTLTKEDLVEAYENASPTLDFPQIEAGLARHQLDWYFGINLSRALTLSLEHCGGYWVLSTGRVQGPTLNLLEERQKEINKFIPVPYWEIGLNGSVDGKEVIASHVTDKFWKKVEADSVMGRCRGKDGVIESVEKKEHKQKPPFPFDLTTLQRESYSLFGYSPKFTLDIAQALYEHALISYPRTSSQKLPAKIGYDKILKALSEQIEYKTLVNKLLAKPKLKPNEGPKDDPAHPSIFPTGNKPKKLNNYQKRVYDLIVRRFMAIFADPAIRKQEKATIDVSGEKFASHGITTIKPNWIEFYGPYAKFKEQALPELSKGDAVKVKSIDMLDKETQPPNRYTQASILKEMEDLGLGTKATRAQILQTLYDRSYIRESSIVVTELGEAVISALSKHCPEIISADLTKKIDDEMEGIEQGSIKRSDIIKKSEEHLKRILAGFKEHEKDIGNEILIAVKEYEKEIHHIGKCDKCGGELNIIHSKRTGKRFVGCTGYPKCSNSFPLPQRGYVQVVQKECANCGLRLIEVRTKGKRPWRFCIKCGFEKKRKTTAKTAAKATTAKPVAKTKAPAKPATKKVVKAKK